MRRAFGFRSFLTCTQDLSASSYFCELVAALLLLDGLFNEDFFTVFLNTFLRLEGFSGCAAMSGDFTILDGCETVLRSFDRFWV